MEYSTPPLARTPLHAWHAARGVRFAQRGGWLLPLAPPEPEGRTPADSGLSLADVSAFVKMAFLGRAVPEFVRLLVGDGLANRPRGVSAISVGGPALACRLAADHLLLLTTTPDGAAVERHLAPLRQAHAVVQADVTTAYASFRLAGGAWEAVLSGLTALDVRPAALPVGSCAETGLAGVPALLVPSAEFGHPGMRICVGWDVAEYVWESLSRGAGARCTRV
jgi:sarcosine oxidase subunit alpha